MLLLVEMLNYLTWGFVLIPEDKYEEIEFPYSMVACGSLEILRLSLLSHRLSLPKFTGFRTLRVLELKKCNLFNDNLVKDFFKSCLLLEDLSLVDSISNDNNRFCIWCPKLKNLRIDNPGRQSFQEWDDAFESMCYRSSSNLWSKTGVFGIYRFYGFWVYSWKCWFLKKKLWFTL